MSGFSPHTDNRLWLSVQATNSFLIIDTENIKTNHGSVGKCKALVFVNQQNVIILVDIIPYILFKRVPEGPGNTTDMVHYFNCE